MTYQRSRVTGTIVFDSNVPAPETGVVHLAVLDVSRADAAAVRVIGAELPIRAATRHGDTRSIPFDLPGAELADGRDYILRAHWEPRGDGIVRSGDQLTTTSIPIVPGDNASVRVPLTGIS